MKPSKVSLGTSLEEALVYRYAVCTTCQLETQTSLQSREKPTGSSHNILVHECTQLGHLNSYLGSTAEEAEYFGTHEYPKDTLRIELYTNPGTYHQLTSHDDLCGAAAAKSCLNRLKSVSLSSMPVYRALYGKSDFFPDQQPEYSSLWPSSGGCLDQFLSSLCDLEMSNCLLSKWTEIAEICIQVPWLKSLNVSNNRIRLPVSPKEVHDKQKENECLESKLLYDIYSDPVLSERLCSNAFPQLSQLTLVKCPLLNWKSIRIILCWMPSLQSLSLAYNNLGNPPIDWEKNAIDAFQKLTDLDLTHINLTAAHQLFALIGASKYLNNLLLNYNEIADIPNLNNHLFRNLNTLGLKNNLFTNWDFVNQLLNLSKLDHVMVSGCPVFENSVNIETARQEVIARLPNLKMLDRVEITPEERRGSELDYLKRYGASWLNCCRSDQNSKQINGSKLLEEFYKLHPVFSRLCDKYGAPEIGETKPVNRSIKAGLISLIFILQHNKNNGTTNKSSSRSSSPMDKNDRIQKQIPSQMTINHLRMMVRRLFCLSPKTLFELYAQSGRHRGIVNTEIPLDVDTREIGFYNLENDDYIFVRI
ncbi:putative tubulin-specific chaperone E [Schistosoma mansoni]|uniref:putative tubulin-specific chaperone E n=1 Tax=Schistosoma mansoni TaxID=6183 RepID=UPI0001A6338E|nr:putative tubulin-specific chaperone E [Schistosoma mansoni]|eukprot:XP_018648374.1 putative tubulin-specific chaperone E [Schistosoma mansoni]